jgi:hypothetical protein
MLKNSGVFRTPYCSISISAIAISEISQNLYKVGIRVCFESKVLFCLVGLFDQDKNRDFCDGRRIHDPRIAMPNTTVRSDTNPGNTDASKLDRGRADRTPSASARKHRKPQTVEPYLPSGADSTVGVQKAKFRPRAVRRQNTAARMPDPAKWDSAQPGAVRIPRCCSPCTGRRTGRPCLPPCTPGTGPARREVTLLVDDSIECRRSTR